MSGWSDCRLNSPINGENLPWDDPSLVPDIRICKDDFLITKPPLIIFIYLGVSPVFPWTNLHLHWIFRHFPMKISHLWWSKWPSHPSGTGIRAPSPAEYRRTRPAERRGRRPPAMWNLWGRHGWKPFVSSFDETNDQIGQKDINCGGLMLTFIDLEGKMVQETMFSSRKIQWVIGIDRPHGWIHNVPKLTRLPRLPKSSKEIYPPVIHWTVELEAMAHLLPWFTQKSWFTHVFPWFPQRWWFSKQNAPQKFPELEHLPSLQALAIARLRSRPAAGPIGDLPPAGGRPGPCDQLQDQRMGCVYKVWKTSEVDVKFISKSMLNGKLIRSQLTICYW